MNRNTKKSSIDNLRYSTIIANAISINITTVNWVHDHDKISNSPK